MDKKNVLLVSDNVVFHSGVANQSAEIAKGLFNAGYEVYQIGVGGMEPKQMFIHTFPTGEQVTIYTDKIYDNIPYLLQIIRAHDIKALILVTDPHKFTQIWLNARTIRAQVPIIYWNLWDTNLLPSFKSKKAHYNQWIYESCDSLPCISQQSENFVRQIIDSLPPERSKPRVSYIPHGSNQNVFKPLPTNEVEKLRNQFFQGQDKDYVVLFNSRNQTRKKAADLIYAWESFFNSMPAEQSAKTALILHTEAISPAGTDLNEVINALAPDCNIYIDSVQRSQSELNILYNIADVTFCVSNAEGFGLSAQESLCAGTPIAATVTGGLQDSIGFLDKNGKRIQFDKGFTSNSTGQHLYHGAWSFPIFPQVQEIIGSPMTPYLFNDCVSHHGILIALNHWHHIPREERKKAGLKGREWCLNQNMTCTALAKNFTREVETTINEYKKSKLFELFKA